MMPQLLAHLVGDYIFQSTWMALKKNKVTWICLIHCFTYTLAFTAITQSHRALMVIFITHFLIDRFGLARYVIWLKESQRPGGLLPFSWCSSTGYFDMEKADSWWQSQPDKEKLQHLGALLMQVARSDDNRPAWIRVWLYIITDNALHLLCNYFALTALR